MTTDTTPAETRYPLPLLDAPPVDAVLGLVREAARTAVEDRLAGVAGTITVLERQRADLVEQLERLDDRLVANYHERIRLGIWLDQ